MSDAPLEKPEPLCPPKRRWWRDVILAIVIFLCGGLVGGVTVTKYYSHRIANIQQNGFDKKRAFMRLKNALGLNEEQGKRVQAILGKGMADLRGIRRAVRPQLEETLQRIREDVAAQLDDRQEQVWNSRFDKMVERWFPRGLDLESGQEEQ